MLPKLLCSDPKVKYPFELHITWSAGATPLPVSLQLQQRCPPGVQL